MIRCFGGLYDGVEMPGEFPHPEVAFLVHGRGRGAIFNLDGTPHPDGPVRVKVHYELAKTISGRLVYVAQDFYAEREEHADSGDAGDTASTGDDATGDRAEGSQAG